MKKAAAKPKPKVKPKVKPKPKPVTVTISRVARANPCLTEFEAALRRVGGRIPKSYANARGGSEYMPSIPGKVRVTATTPIPLMKIYRMKSYWATWISETVLSQSEWGRWEQERERERERLARKGM